MSPHISCCIHSGLCTLRSPRASSTLQVLTFSKNREMCFQLCGKGASITFAPIQYSIFQNRPVKACLIPNLDWRNGKGVFFPLGLPDIATNKISTICAVSLTPDETCEHDILCERLSSNGEVYDWFGMKMIQDNSIRINQRVSIGIRVIFRL